jgi:hypothetical protein
VPVVVIFFLVKLATYYSYWVRTSFYLTRPDRFYVEVSVISLNNGECSKLQK